jgi:hypothetical protein
MVSRRGQRVTFRTICCGAREVFLVGDFNGWSTQATPMQRIGRDLWQRVLSLAPGEYRFRYFTGDNRWITDYNASGIAFNDLGECEGLLRIPPPDEPQLSIPSSRPESWSPRDTKNPSTSTPRR